MKMRLFIVLLSLLFAGTAWGQTGQTENGDVPFNGLVVDADGAGVRVRVKVKGTDKVTTADKRGRFGLTNVADSDVLVVSYRRDEFEIPVAGRKSLKILWTGDTGYSASESDELADLGFMYVKRREKIDSSSGISGDELRRLGTSNLRDALLSRVPGLMLVNGEICVRGIGSINSGNGALILCDGHETSINSININEVESVEVLKGSNMYGFRGANGVILIKTKSAASAK